jgi:hypothetical protein
MADTLCKASRSAHLRVVVAVCAETATSMAVPPLYTPDELIAGRTGANVRRAASGVIVSVQVLPLPSATRSKQDDTASLHRRTDGHFRRF